MELTNKEEDIVLEGELERWRESKEYKEKHQEIEKVQCNRCEECFDINEMDRENDEWICRSCEDGDIINSDAQLGAEYWEKGL